MTKRNLFYFIQFCILLFGVSFPFWQTTEVFHIFHPLWVIIPGGLFMTFFAMAFGTVFDFNLKLTRYLKKTIGYWLGGSFILFCTTILLLWVNTFVDVPETWIAGFGLAMASILISYAYYHAKHIYITSISFSSKKLKKQHTFVQLSDIHIGSNGIVEVKRIIKHLDNLSYDFIVITGDLVDEDFASHDALKLFNTINKPMYYITGNHEYYLRHKHFQDFIDDTNIIDINDKKIVFDNITLLGIDEKSRVQNIIPALKINSDSYVIGLMHEPNSEQVKEADVLGVDLMLSGHTHNGQIFPLTLLVKLRYFFLKGFYPLDKMNLYVSQGTGTWGPKMRLGTHNEITLIRLVPEE